MTKREMQIYMEKLIEDNVKLHEQIERLTPVEPEVQKVALKQRAAEVANTVKAEGTKVAGKAISVTGKTVRGLKSFVVNNWRG